MRTMTIYRVFIQYKTERGEMVGTSYPVEHSKSRAKGVARWYKIELERLGCSDIKIHSERQEV